MASCYLIYKGPGQSFSKNKMREWKEKMLASNVLGEHWISFTVLSDFTMKWGRWGRNCSNFYPRDNDSIRSRSFFKSTSMVSIFPVQPNRILQYALFLLQHVQTYFEKVWIIFDTSKEFIFRGHALGGQVDLLSYRESSQIECIQSIAQISVDTSYLGESRPERPGYFVFISSCICWERCYWLERCLVLSKFTHVERC